MSLIRALDIGHTLYLESERLQTSFVTIYDIPMIQCIFKLNDIIVVTVILVVSFVHFR